MPSSLFKLVAAAVSIVGLASAGPKATPYTDGLCKTPVSSYSYTTRNGTALQNTPFSTGTGVSANGNGTTYSNYEAYTDLNFDLPPASNESLGQFLYWKFTGLDKTCRVLFMTPPPLSSVGAIPGQIILNAGDANECYFSDPGAVLYTSFCCGVGDCTPFDVQESQLSTKRDVQTTVNGGGHLTRRARANVQRHTSTVIAGGPSSNVFRTAGFSNARAKRGLKPRTPSPAQIINNLPTTIKTAKACDAGDTDCYNEQWGACSYNIVGDMFTQPGQQVAVSDFTSCSVTSQGGCAITHTTVATMGGEVSVASTNSNTNGGSSSQSSSETNTNTAQTVNKNGYTNTVGVSVGWGPVSASASHSSSSETTNTNTNTNTQTSVQASSESYSNTVANTTQHSISTTNGEQVSQTFSVMPGGYAILTFLPTYNCWHVNVDCGSPWTDGNGNNVTTVQKICVPETTSQGAQGSYALLYTNQNNS